MFQLSRLAPRGEDCSIAVQDTFGPGVQGCYGGFDFTLYFEEAFLSITPSAVFLVATAVRVWMLHRQNAKVRDGALFVIKLVALSIYAILQLVLMALWAVSSTPKTRLSLAAAVLSFVTAAAFTYLSQLEHRMSFRPSKTLNLYFFFTLLFDIPRARTQWAVPGLHTITSIFIASMIVKMVVFVLEVTEKPSLIKEQYFQATPEVWSGVFNRSLFWWFNPLLLLGSKKVLVVDDLYEVEKSMVPDSSQKHKLALLWEQCSDQEKTHALLVCAIKVYKWELLAGIFPRICQTAFSFAQPYLIEATVGLFSEPEYTPIVRDRGIALIGAFAIVYCGIAVSTAQAQHRSYRVISMLRGALITMIFEKSTTIASNSNDDSAALTLMSTDIERISSGLRYMHDAWASFIEIGIALWLLYIQLNVAAIAPIVVAILCTLAAIIVAIAAGQKQKIWIEAIQKRVSLTAEMLGAMKGVKMSGLVERLYGVIQGLRIDEIIMSQHFRSLLIGVVALAHFNTALTPVITFTIFAFISKDGKYGYLDSTRVLTSLTLFNLFANFVSMVVEAATGTVTGIDCIDRIREFLIQPAREDPRISGRSSLDSSPSLDEKYCLELRSASVGWKAGAESVLHNLNLRVRNSQLVMIVGPVGSGKSTLIQSLLGEVPYVSGEIRVNFDQAAYCSQVPWLTNGTVQHNILGASDYDMMKYLTTIEVCGLQKDLEHFPQSDQTLVGSQGVSLSGGQKQRITLARAVYSELNTVFLDDVMSGLDPVTEEHIFSKLLGPGGLFKTRGTTVIMVTNSIHRLPYADHIVAMNADGTIMEQGSFKKVQGQLEYAQGIAPTVPMPAGMKPKSEGPAKIEAPFSDGYREEEVTDADRLTGDLSTYKYYFATANWHNWSLYLFFAVVFVFFQSFPTVWATWWAEDNDAEPNRNLSMRIGVYWMFGILGVIFLVLMAWFLMTSIVAKTARVLHSRLLTTVLHAPMLFFSSTDSGVTINRFSQDLELIDMELPLSVLNTTVALLVCIAQLAIISASAKYIAATIPAVLLAYYFIQNFYLRTSRQLRVMDIEAKSPLFSNFLETISGLATIRAYSWQQDYSRRNETYLAASQRPFYLLYAVQRWLSLVLDMTVAGFAVLLVGIAVATLGKISAGFIGLALVNVASLSEAIKAMITQWTILETSLGAVTRVKSFTEGLASEHQPKEKDLPPENWPMQGAIAFDNVSAYYKNPSQPALKNVSFRIGKGEKVGICGRSGSGKSSLVSALFRLLEISDGAVLVDGVDISTLPRNEVRSQIIGLPQDPCLLDGSTIRENVDPFNYTPEAAIISALKQVELWETIEPKGGLEATVSSELLSQGQRQLLCLAKAMLREGNIIVFDEATSSVDIKTDELMQEIIRTHFAKHTVIAVTHRLDTIIDFDKVLVMDHGTLIENDNPRMLLASPTTFRGLYKSSRGWAEYERQEREEQERREREQQEQMEKERATAGLQPMAMMSAEELQMESEIVSTVREYWEAVNNMFGIVRRDRRPSLPRNRSLHRRSTVRSQHPEKTRSTYVPPMPTEPGAAYQRPRAGSVGAVSFSSSNKRKSWGSASERRPSNGHLHPNKRQSWTDRDTKRLSWTDSQWRLSRVPPMKRDSFGGLWL